ncbi:MAG: hypothetical protein ACPG06_06050 [Alphaproteobacteria bacterium]
MNISTNFDWSSGEATKASDPLLATGSGNSYQELVWEIGEVWGNFVAQISEALGAAGYFDITADQALRLYGLTNGDPLGCNAITASNRNAHDTSQLYRNNFLTRSVDTGTPIATARGMAVAALIDDVLSAQAFAIEEDAPLQPAQFTAITRALKHLSRWIKDAA